MHIRDGRTLTVGEGLLAAVDSTVNAVLQDCIDHLHSALHADATGGAELLCHLSKEVGGGVTTSCGEESCCLSHEPSYYSLWGFQQGYCLSQQGARTWLQPSVCSRKALAPMTPTANSIRSSFTAVNWALCI